MRTLSALLAVVLFSAAAPPPKDATQRDLDQMQGDWAVVSMTYEGEDLPADDAQAIFRTIKGHEFTTFLYDKPLEKGTFTIDARPTPKTIDEQPGGGGKLKHGIYELAGDRLKICLHAAGGARPKEFKSAPGSGTVLIVLEKQKK